MPRIRSVRPGSSRISGAECSGVRCTYLPLRRGRCACGFGVRCFRNIRRHRPWNLTGNAADRRNFRPGRAVRRPEGGPFRVRIVVGRKVPAKKTKCLEKVELYYDSILTLNLFISHVFFICIISTYLPICISLDYRKH